MIGENDWLLIKSMIRSELEPLTKGTESRAIQHAESLSESVTGVGDSCLIPDTLSDNPGNRMPRPFNLYYDLLENEWKMYLPEGSLYVKGKSVKLDPPDTVETDVAYLHVKTQGEEPKAVIDQEETKDGFDYHCVVYRMEEDPDIGWVIKDQVLNGALHLSQGTSTPGCFDPDYDEEGAIVGVLRPYVMCGRKVIIASGTPADGVNVVRVDHAYDNVTATIMAGDVTPDNSTDTYTDIPLYKIKDNVIIEDYRNMPHVPLYDPVSS